MKILDKIEEIFCGTALLATTLILFWNVILRFVFHSSTTWSEEVIKYLMIWIAFIGGSICARKGAHVSIDFLLEYLSEGKKKIVSIIVHMIAVIFSGSMVYYGVKVIKFIASMNQISPALQIPMWIPYLAIPIGFVLMFLRFGQGLLKLMKPTLSDNL